MDVVTARGRPMRYFAVIRFPLGSLLPPLRVRTQRQMSSSATLRARDVALRRLQIGVGFVEDDEASSVSYERAIPAKRRNAR